MDRVSVRFRIAIGFIAILMVLGGVYLVSVIKLMRLEDSVSSIVKKTEIVQWVDEYAEHVLRQSASLRTYAFSGLGNDKEAVEASQHAAQNSRRRAAAVLALANQQDIVTEFESKNAVFEGVFDRIEHRLANSKDALKVVVLGVGELRRSGALLQKFLLARREPKASGLANQVSGLIDQTLQYGVAYVADGKVSDYDTAIKAAENLDVLISSITEFLGKIPRSQKAIVRFVRRDGDIVRQSLRQSFATKSGLQKALDQLAAAANDINKITKGVEHQSRAQQSAALEGMVTAVSGAIKSSIVGFLIGGALVGIMAIVIGRSIAGPLGKITTALTALAAGKRETNIPGQNRQDELGTLAKAAAVFKDRAQDNERMATEKNHAEMALAEQDQRRRNERAVLIEKHKIEEAENRLARGEVRKLQRLKMAEAFERRVLLVVEAVNTAARDVAIASKGLVANSAQTRIQVQQSAAAMNETSSNVQSVAGSAEELAVSFGTVGDELRTSAKIAQQAVGQAAHTTDTVKGLADAADQIGAVTHLIKDIADQTNLLALNATIEAVRAGDAGHGFAVVAQEVKILAAQSSESAEEISRYVGTIQEVSSKSGAAIGDISATIKRMNDVTQSVVVAVDQQTTATREIASHVNLVGESTEQVQRSIDIVDSAADEMQSTSTELQKSAEALTDEAVVLDQEVRMFLEEIRAGDDLLETSDRDEVHGLRLLKSA